MRLLTKRVLVHYRPPSCRQAGIREDRGESLLEVPFPDWLVDNGLGDS